MKYMVQTGMMPGENWEEKFDAAAKTGVDAVELSGVSGVLTNNTVDEIMKASDKSSVKPKVICGGYSEWIGHTDENARKTAIDNISESMKFAAAMGIEGLIAPAAVGMTRQFRIERSADEDGIVLRDSLTRIAEAAEKHKVYLYFEPLNRYEDHMVNRVETAVEMIDDVGSEYIKAMFDLFHGSIEEKSITDTIIKYASYIKHIHLADSSRKLPGSGHTDYASIIKTFKEINFDGYLSFECGFPGMKGKITEVCESLALLKSME